MTATWNWQKTHEQITPNRDTGWETSVEFSISVPHPFINCWKKCSINNRQLVVQLPLAVSFFHQLLVYNNHTLIQWLCNKISTEGPNYICWLNFGVSEKDSLITALITCACCHPPGISIYAWPSLPIIPLSSIGKSRLLLK